MKTTIGMAWLVLILSSFLFWSIVIGAIAKALGAF